MKVQQQCIDEFPMIKRGVNTGVFAIENEQVDVYDVHERNSESWESFVSSLPDDKCCHVFTHFPYVAESDNVARDKFIHILWAPYAASKKDKMQLSFFARNVLISLGAEGASRIEAGSKSSLEYGDIREKVVRNITVK